MRGRWERLRDDPWGAVAWGVSVLPIVIGLLLMV